MSQALRLQDKVIFVTGAGSGIGRAVSIAYAKEGATVILSGKTVGKLEKVYDEIMAAGGPEPAIFPLNHLGATPEHYLELAQSIQQHFGRLDGLLHNAAHFTGLTPTEHYAVDKWYNTLQVNLNAAFLLTQALLPVMHLAPSASLLFTTAKSGYQPKAYWGAYGVSKAGIEAFAQILNDELENTNVRVNLIDPGCADTALHRKAYPALDHETLPRPEDITESYIYLMSDESKNLRGERVQVLS